jgi:hypothetical protein
MPLTVSCWTKPRLVPPSYLKYLHVAYVKCLFQISNQQHVFLLNQIFSRLTTLTLCSSIHCVFWPFNFVRLPPLLLYIYAIGLPIRLILVDNSRRSTTAASDQWGKQFSSKLLRFSLHVVNRHFVASLTNQGTKTCLSIEQLIPISAWFMHRLHSHSHVTYCH